VGFALARQFEDSGSGIVCESHRAFTDPRATRTVLQVYFRRLELIDEQIAQLDSPALGI